MLTTAFIYKKTKKKQQQVLKGRLAVILLVIIYSFTTNFTSSTCKNIVFNKTVR